MDITEQTTVNAEQTQGVSTATTKRALPTDSHEANTLAATATTGDTPRERMQLLGADIGERVRPQFTTEVLKGGTDTWKQYYQQMGDILRDSFPTMNPVDRMQTLLQLQKQCEREDARIILLRGQDKNIAGYTMYFPINQAEWKEEPFLSEVETLQREQAGQPNRALDAYREILSHAAEVGWTAIAPNERGKGGWTALMDTLDREVTEDSRGFEHVAQVVRVEGDYAAKVQKRYADRIVYSADTDGRALGPQKYYRIAMTPSASPAQSATAR